MATNSRKLPFLSGLALTPAGQSYDATQDTLGLTSAASAREARFQDLVRSMTDAYGGAPRGILPMGRTVLPDSNMDAFFGRLGDLSRGAEAQGKSFGVNWRTFGQAHQVSDSGPNAGLTQAWGEDPMAGAEIGPEGYTGRIRNKLGNVVDQGPFGGANVRTGQALSGLRRAMKR